MRYGRELSFAFDTAYLSVGIFVHLTLAAWLDWWREHQRDPARHLAEEVAGRHAQVLVPAE